MKTTPGTEVCDNVPIAVDPRHTLLVAHEVTHDVTDLAQLATLANRAKDTLEAERVEAVADMGYYNGEEVKKC